MRDNPGGDELDPAKGVRRRCKKNSLSVLSCIGKRTSEGCDRGSDVGQFTADEGQFLSEETEGIWQEREL